MYKPSQHTYVLQSPQNPQRQEQPSWMTDCLGAWGHYGGPEQALR